MQQMYFFIADLIACSTCFGHNYAHHQELMSIIQWFLPVGFGAVKMEDVIYKLNGIRVFWVLSIMCFIDLFKGMSSVVGVVCGYHRWFCYRVVLVGSCLWVRYPVCGVGGDFMNVEAVARYMC